MDGCHGLMDAQHDNRQPEPSQDKAGHGTAFMDGNSYTVTDGGGDHAAYGLKDKEGGKACNQDGKQRCQKQIQHGGNDFPEAQLQPGTEGCHQQHGNNAAPAGLQLLTAQHDVLEGRVGDDCRQYAAQDGGTAEFLGGIEADKQVHAVEDGIAHDGKHFYPCHISKGGLGFQQQV